MITENAMIATDGNLLHESFMNDRRWLQCVAVRFIGEVGIRQLAEVVVDELDQAVSIRMVAAGKRYQDLRRFRSHR